MIQILTFQIPGKPVPKERVRVKGGRAYTPKRTRAYEDKVAKIALLAMRQQGVKRFTCPIALIIEVHPDTRGDFSNIAKSVEDAMNRVVYDDDRQVRYLTVSPTLDVDEVMVTVRPLVLEDTEHES